MEGWDGRGKGLRAAAAQSFLLPFSAALNLVLCFFVIFDLIVTVFVIKAYSF